MRVEYLSDHVGDLMRQAEGWRDQAAADARYWYWCWQQAEGERLAARKARPLWRKLLGLTTPAEMDALGRAKLMAEWLRRAEVGRHYAEGELAKAAAGKRAENLLALDLSRLSDDWLLFRGFKARGGEIDGVLVGPAGVWAIEVKSHNVALIVDGDSWLMRRPNGRLERAVDGGGRSWGREVADPAAALTDWLRRHSVPVAVRTAVLVLHEERKASIERCVNPGVDVVGSDVNPLLQAIGGSPVVLDPTGCRDVAEAIRGDHAAHSREQGARAEQTSEQ